MNTARIHRSCVHSTIIQLMLELGNTNQSLFKYTLIGSSRLGGTKEYMGDIDVAVDDSDINSSRLKELLIERFGDNAVSSHGVLSLRFPIHNEDFEPNDDMVQIDFMFGDVTILSAMYFSPFYNGVEAPINSPLKSSHCHIMISLYFSLYPLGIKEYTKLESDIDNEYRMVFRYKWASTSGVQMVIRHQKFDVERDKWVRDIKDQVLTTIYPDYELMSKLVVNWNADKYCMMSTENFLVGLTKYKGKGIASNLLDALESDSKGLKEWSESDIEYLRNFINGIKTS